MACGLVSLVSAVCLLAATLAGGDRSVHHFQSGFRTLSLRAQTTPPGVAFSFPQISAGQGMDRPSSFSASSSASSSSAASSAATSTSPTSKPRARIAWPDFAAISSLAALGLALVHTTITVLRRTRQRSRAAPLLPLEVSMCAASSSTETDPDQEFTLPAPAIFTPYIGKGRRRTVRTELVPGAIWGFEQNQELSALSVNIRCTVVRLADRSLWVHAPVFPTNEFLTQLDALGEVRYIVLPTFALEHKLPIITFAQKYPAAQVWAVPDTWSWPVNLPLSLLGIPVRGLIGQDPAPWASEIDVQVLKIDDVGSPFVEAAFFHRATRTLLVTDTLYCIPRQAPAVIDGAKLLEVAPDDPARPLLDTPEARLQGWAKMALLVSFFIPARQRLVKGGKAEWQSGYMKSFDAIAGKLIVSPILQALVLAKSKALILPWLERVCQWDVQRVIPAHYDAPVTATVADIRAAFGFVTGDDDAMQLPMEDMRTLLDLQAIVKKASSGEGEVYTELFDKFFKNLFLEKSGWMQDK
eukprot:EG_transcript_5740